MGSASSNVLDAATRQKAEATAQRLLHEFKEQYERRFRSSLLEETASDFAPPAVSPYRLSRTTSNRPIKTGYLTKEGLIKRTWKRRFFVVQHDYSVVYYEDEQAYETQAKPKGNISCGDYTVFASFDGYHAHGNEQVFQRLGIQPQTSKTAPDNTFVLTGEGRRPWYLACDSAPERRDWVETFRLCSLRAKGFKDNDQASSAAFCSALNAVRHSYGLKSQLRFGGSETEVLLATVMEVLRKNILEATVYPLIREQPEKSRQSIYESVEADLLAEVSSAIETSYAACRKQADTFRSSVVNELTSEAKQYAEISAQLDQQVRSLLEPALAPELRSSAAPTALMISEGCVEPLERAADSLMKVWSLHIAEAMPSLRMGDKSALELLPTVVDEFDPKPVLDGKLGIVTQLGGEAPNLIELAAQLRSLLANAFSTFSQAIWSGKDGDVAYDDTLDLTDNDSAVWVGETMRSIALDLVYEDTQDAARSACSGLVQDVERLIPEKLSRFTDAGLIVEATVRQVISDCVQSVAFRVAELVADDQSDAQANTDLGFELLNTPHDDPGYEEPIEEDDEELSPEELAAAAAAGGRPLSKTDEEHHYEVPRMKSEQPPNPLSPNSTGYAAPPVTSQMSAPLEEMPWYHGVMSRGDAERRVKSHSQEFPFGTTIFLVRKSISSPRDFAITCLKVGMGDASGKALIVHLMVKARDDGFRADIPNGEKQPSFPTLSNLVDFYRLPATLGSPFGQLGSTVPRSQEPNVVLPRTTSEHVAPLAVQDLGEQLIIEGYLLKIRGVGQNRRRFFRLTNKSFMYLTEEAGELMADIPVDEIKAISNVHKTQFRIVTKHPFGTSTAATDELLLKAPDVRVKNCWVRALQQTDNLSSSWRQHTQPGKLKAEGYLKKVVGGVSKSRMRWFVLTDETFAYYFKQGDERMAILDLKDITTVCGTNDDKEFRIVANHKFTVTGHHEVTLRTATRAARNRWVKALSSVLPPDKVVH